MRSLASFSTWLSGLSEEHEYVKGDPVTGWEVLRFEVLGLALVALVLWALVSRIMKKVNASEMPAAREKESGHG